MTLIPGNSSINMCKICNKIHQKSTKYPLLEPPWGSLGTILAALGNQDAPKRRPRAPRRRQHGPTWFNLAPTWRPRAPQILPKRRPRPLPDPLLQQVWRFCRPFQHLHRFSLDFLNNFKELKTCKILVFSRENAIFYKIRNFR